MIGIFVAAIGSFLIVGGAIRIIAGWIFSKATVQKIDAAFWFSAKLFFKLCVVATAALIVWFVWFAIKN